MLLYNVAINCILGVGSSISAEPFSGPYKSIEMLVVTWLIRSCTQIHLSCCICREINCWRAENAWNSFSDLLFHIFWLNTRGPEHAFWTCKEMKIIGRESRRQEQVSELRQHQDQLRYEFSKFRHLLLGNNCRLDAGSSISFPTRFQDQNKA